MIYIAWCKPMDGLLLLSLTVLVPVLFGIISYLVPGYNLKKYSVILCALVLSVASLLVLYNGPQNLTVESINMGITLPVSTIIVALDFLLMLVFLYYGYKDRDYKILGLAVLQLVLLSYLEFFAAAGEAAGATFVIDDLSIVMCLIVSLIGSLILIYSIGYMKGDKNVSSFFLIMMVFLGDMNALIFANDLTWLFFFWEGTTLCSFLLIRHYRDTPSIKASDRALWMNLLGGVAMVCGIILVEAMFGTRFLSDLLTAKATMPGWLSFLPAAAIVLPFAFMAFGAFTKSALMPFNSWLTGAMVAPTPVSALLHSSTMVDAGVYMLIRIAPLILVFEGAALSNVITIAGGFSFMFCALLAVSQTDTKRILAYSTISYLGLIAMCTGINTGLAITAAVALLVFHAVSKGLLFLCVGEITHITGSRDIDQMQGLIAKAPLVAIITVVGLISLMAPPFGIFVGKWLAFHSASTFTRSGGRYSPSSSSSSAASSRSSTIRGGPESCSPRDRPKWSRMRTTTGIWRSHCWSCWQESRLGSADYRVLEPADQSPGHLWHRAIGPGRGRSAAERHRRVLAIDVPDHLPGDPAHPDTNHKGAKVVADVHVLLRDGLGA